eukprot:TRINITY_DN8095_c0_g1_i3.p1 TRINITY_DN8095_c0_g1~~TRINITY_DN8095_c0_g1_i3.p1  ORF type:complete len:117 (-),score=17.96 TRINITY_DN8095_c0_g1_i3:442-792(-)
MDHSDVDKQIYPNWVVVHKPPKMHVHPMKWNEEDTLLNGLAALYPFLSDGDVGEGGLRSGIVHRLDYETSGAVVVALKSPTWEILRNAFKNRLVTKVYHAIVCGCPEPSRCWHSSM